MYPELLGTLALNVDLQLAVCRAHDLGTEQDGAVASGDIEQLVQKIQIFNGNSTQLDEYF